MKSKKIFKTSMFGYKKCLVINYIAGLDGKLREITDELDRKNKLADEYKQKTEEMQNKISILEKNNSEQIASLESTINFLKEENAKQSSDFKEKIDLKISEEEELKNDYNVLLTEYKNLEEQNEAYEEKIKALNRENETNNEKVSKLQEDYNKNIEIFADRMSAYEKSKQDIIDGVMQAQKQAGAIIDSANIKAENIISSAKKESNEIYSETSRKLKAQIDIVNKKIEQKIEQKNIIKNDIDKLLYELKNNFDEFYLNAVAVKNDSFQENENIRKEFTLLSEETDKKDII